jgi:hypothetical protein
MGKFEMTSNEQHQILLDATLGAVTDAIKPLSIAQKQASSANMIAGKIS